MKIKRHQILMTVIVLTGLLFILSACSGDDSPGRGGTSDKIELHLGTTASTSNPIYQAMVEFADELDERSDGTMELVLDIAGAHGGDREIVEGVMNGTIAMGYNADIGVAAVIPEIGYVNLPYLFPTRDDVYSLYFDGWIGEAYAETLAENGIIVLGRMMESDFRWMSNSRNPIDTADSLKNLKIRVPENPMYLAFFEKIGTQPVAMSVTEVAAALQQGVIDGQDNGPILTYSLGFYEFQPHLTRTNHAYAGASWLVSQKLWDTLTEEQQELLAELGEKYSVIGHQYMLDAIAGIEEEMREAGVEIIDLSPELDVLFETAAYEVWLDDNITKNFNQDVMARIRSELMD